MSDIDENMESAALAAAEAAERSAEKISEAAKAKASKDVADAALAATAAAEAAAALANANAAVTINDNKENLEWLHQHAANVDTSLKSLSENQNQMLPQVQSMLEASQARTLEAVSALLTPLPLTQESQTQVDPIKESEDEAARLAKEKTEASKKKQKRRFI